MIAVRLGAIALVGLLSYASCYADDRALVADGVRSGLLWEARWYGHHFGQRCLQRAIDRGAVIRALIKPVEITVGFNCSSGDAVRQVVQRFEATVDGAGIFLSGEVAPVTRAEISDGEDNPTCTVTEDDLRRRATDLKSAGLVARVKAIRENGKESKASPALNAFAARTIALWASKEKLRPPRSIYVGPVGLNDPFLVIGVGDRVVLIRSPDSAQAISPDFCGVVLSPHRFAGREAAQSLRGDEVSRLSQRLAKAGVEVPCVFR